MLAQTHTYRFYNKLSKRCFQIMNIACNRLVLLYGALSLVLQSFVIPSFVIQSFVLPSFVLQHRAAYHLFYTSFVLQQGKMYHLFYRVETNQTNKPGKQVGKICQTRCHLNYSSMKQYQSPTSHQGNHS